jgi:hypothetical protein
MSSESSGRRPLSLFFRPEAVKGSELLSAGSQRSGDVEREDEEDEDIKDLKGSRD